MEIVPIAVAWMELMEFVIWFFSTFLIWGMGLWVQRTQKDKIRDSDLSFLVGCILVAGMVCMVWSLLYELPQALKTLALVYSS